MPLAHSSPLTTPVRARTVPQPQAMSGPDGAVVFDQLQVSAVPPRPSMGSNTAYWNQLYVSQLLPALQPGTFECVGWGGVGGGGGGGKGARARAWSVHRGRMFGSAPHLPPWPLPSAPTTAPPGRHCHRPSCRCRLCRQSSHRPTPPTTSSRCRCRSISPPTAWPPCPTRSTARRCGCARVLGGGVAVGLEGSVRQCCVCDGGGGRSRRGVIAMPVC